MKSLNVTAFEKSQYHRSVWSWCLIYHICGAWYKPYPTHPSTHLFKNVDLSYLSFSDNVGVKHHAEAFLMLRTAFTCECVSPQQSGVEL